MSASTERLAAALDGIRRTQLRREPREDTVRIVEYTRFPRLGTDAGLRVGFTRDMSRSGMCIGADDPEPAGSLLRLSVQGFDGDPEPACLARVVWCSHARDGRFWLGLERITAKS
jgi:hypothetical protein